MTKLPKVGASVGAVGDSVGARDADNKFNRLMSKGITVSYFQLEQLMEE